MPRDSAGVFTLPPTTWATTGQTISVDQHNPAMREIETAITDSLPRNGSAGMTGHLNMAGFRITDIANPIADGDAVSLGFARNATPVGMVMDYAGDFAPEGWVLCDGRSLSRTTYAALFAVIGTKFGSDNATTFKVPDLRGRVIAGLDNMGGSSANRITSAASGFNPNTIGSAGGSQSHTLTIGEMPSHNHGVNDPGHAHNGFTAFIGNSLGPGAGTVTSNGALGQVTLTGSTGASATGISIQNAGNNEAHPNMQPTMVMNKIIRAS